MKVRSDPPASRTRTVWRPLALRRSATTHPALPAPITTKSKLSCIEQNRHLSAEAVVCHSTYQPSTAPSADTDGRTGDWARRWWVLTRGILSSRAPHENPKARDIQQRVRLLRARDHGCRRHGLGPDLDLQRRHHGDDISSASSALGAQRGCDRYRFAGQPNRGERAQISGQLSVSSVGRARHGALGFARQTRPQTGGRITRREAGGAAGVCVVHEARHLTRR